MFKSTYNEIGAFLCSIFCMFAIVLIMTRIAKKILLLFIICVCYVQAYSQTHVFKHYGIADGLPSSEVYSAFQDSKGYMWFATDAGVSRFNGYEFENFDVTDGLTDNTVFLITEDHKGRIWFGTFNCQLSYYENDTIYPFEHNDKLEQAGFSEKGAMQSFAIDSNDNIWMGFFVKGILRISSNGEIKQMVNNSENINISYFETSRFECFGHLIPEYRLGGHLEQRIELSLNLNDTNLIHQFQAQATGYIYQGYHIKKYKEGWFLFMGQKSFFLKNNSGSFEMRAIDFPLTVCIHSLMSDDEFLWVSTRDNGVYQCEIKGDSLVVVHHFFVNESVSRVFKDNSNGYWFMTLKNGIHYLSSEEVNFLAIDEGDAILSLSVDTNHSKLFLGFSKGKIAQLNQSDSLSYFEELFKINVECAALMFDYSDQSLLAGSSDSTGYLPFYKSGQLFYKPFKGVRPCKAIMSYQDNFYGVSPHGVYAVQNNRSVYESFLSGEERIWGTSIIDYKGEVWVGTKEGVRIYMNKKVHNPFANNPYLSSSITSMAKWSDDILLVGTKSYGVLVVKRDSVISIITEKEGLSSNLVKCIHVDNEGVIWAGTNSGISRIDYRSGEGFAIKNLISIHGLVSEEINAICSYKNTIYVGTNKGLVQFDKAKLKTNTTPPPVFFTQFIVNSEEREVEKNLNLPHDENFIKIHFEGLNYRSLGEVEYQYRLLGVDTNWVTTTLRSVQYPTLQADEYTFEVKAKNEDGFWSKPEVISFTINPPFWTTWWFISLEILLGIGIVSVMFWYREKQNQLKLESEKRMVELELKALRSQMNPHFIFNTLNAIQNAIYSLDKKVAVGYVSKFGKLIRIVLESSKYAKIDLDLEIEMLTHYIDLEAIRFSGKFQYNIEVDPILKEDSYLIPTMMIQPFIENSILHGLLPQKGDNLSLTIAFRLRDEETLICTIEDNGIGRGASAKLNQLKNLNKQSMGVDITDQRLNLYSKDESHDFSYQIIDLEDDDKNALGTRVQLIFPI